MGRYLELLVLAYFLVVGFFITAPWFASNCSSTTHGDLEAHFFNSLLFQDQLTKYGTIYPLTFDYSKLGYYYFSYSSLPFLFPLLFSFLNTRVSFFIIYTLFYSFSGFFFFVMLRKFNGNFLSSLIISSLFIFSGFMNQQFTVHGSYHSIAVVPFFILTMLFLQRSIDSPNKLNLAFFALFSSLTMLMHFIMLVLLGLFMTIYLFFIRKKLLWFVFVLSALITSFYYVPLFFQSLILPKISDLTLGLSDFFKVISFSLMLVKPENGNTGMSDYYYGPFSFIVALLFFFVFKKKLFDIKKSSFERTVFFFFLSALLLVFLRSIIGFLNQSIPLDRISFFFEFSLFLCSAVLLSKISFKLELPILLLLFALLSNNIFINILFISSLVYFLTARKFSFSKPSTNNIILISSFFIMLLPFTPLFPTSLNFSRVWCTYLPNTSFLDSSNLALFYNRDFFVSTIPYLTGSGIVNNIGHTTLLKEMPVYEDGLVFFDFIRRAGIDRFVVPSAQGNNTVLFYFRGYPSYLTVYGFDVEPVPYSINIINPINLSVSLTESLSNLSLRIHYHPWWRAYANGRELLVSQDDWFVNVAGLDGVNSFNLVFDMTYFNLGNLFSLLGFIFLLIFIYRFY